MSGGSCKLGNTIQLVIYNINASVRLLKPKISLRTHHKPNLDNCTGCTLTHKFVVSVSIVFAATAFIGTCG